MKVSLKQVRLNKDASKGRDKDRIAGRELPDLIAGCLLIIYFRYIADFQLLFISHGQGWINL